MILLQVIIKSCHTKTAPQTVDKLQIVVCRGVNEYITITSNNNMVNNVVLNCRGGSAFLAS
jgi:hypothetical protein